MPEDLFSISKVWEIIGVAISPNSKPGILKLNNHLSKEAACCSGRTRKVIVPYITIQLYTSPFTIVYLFYMHYKTIQ